jgi:Myotubularin-like phosphatase domain
LENEVFSYNTIPIGYVAKYKFFIEKKEHHYLDIDTKDQRKLKFRFDTAFLHQRASDAMSRHCEISKHRDLFAFDHSKKLREEPESAQTVFLNDGKVIDIVMRDIDKMISGTEGVFKRIEIDQITRQNWKIDLPQSVVVPFILGDGAHLKCSKSRANGRFPTLTYYNKEKGYALWRSSQLSIDTTIGQSTDDVAYLKCINKNAGPNQKLYYFNPADKKTTKPFPFEKPTYYERSQMIVYGMADVKQVGAAFEAIWGIC